MASAVRLKAGTAARGAPLVSKLPLVSAAIRQLAPQQGYAVIATNTSKGLVTDLDMPKKDFEEERIPYWQNIPRWKDISEEQFLTFSWQVS